ncbi:TPA: hypothetical protein HA280_02430 [Candidatus Woesearchaeota archaeon]|nr:hypothetical protein [Candidatus Woesearchaeota archaeon]
MADAKTALKEWMMQFIKSRDAFFRKIAEISNHGDELLVKYKDGREQRVLTIIDFSKASSALEGCGQDTHVAIATLSNRKNKDALAAQWKSLASYPFLTLYFVNPYSSGEKKWALMPHVHQKVCDNTHLMQGFLSLSETVEDITEEQLAAKG